MTDTATEDLLRELAPQVLAVWFRRHGQFDACEDAVQEALLSAASTWPSAGIPEHPRAWLLAVAARRLVDEWRQESSRRRREVAAFAPAAHADLAGKQAAAETIDEDDTLTLLLMCCHPALSPPSQLALTLRAVGGLTTSEIARAFLVPESTMAQRISRAKQAISKAGAAFELPPVAERQSRVRVVLHVLYLIFNEGYLTSGGPTAGRTDLTDEAIRLTRLLFRSLPDSGEAAGLLALMLLTDARRPARIDANGCLVALGDQERSLWRSELINEGVALISATLGKRAVGPYQIQAAIAAVHDEAASDAATDWPQILALYEVLDQISPGPVVTLNRAVAVGRVHGPLAGLAILGTLDDDARMTRNHRLDAVRGHLLELAGDHLEARSAYQRASKLTTSVHEQRYLALRAARLG